MMKRQSADGDEKAAIAEGYITAQGRGDLGTIAGLLAEGLQFRIGCKLSGKARYLKTLRRLGLVWNNNRIKRIFIDRDEACAFNDFEIDTDAGTVACVEWIRFAGAKIAAIDFLFKRENWAIVEAELQRHSAAAAAPDPDTAS